MRRFRFFLRLDELDTLFLLVLALGTFLRFFKLNENIVFHGELGDNYLAIKNFIAQGQIPLLGPATSHPWLSFGPLYYWIFTPILILFHYDPLAGAYFFAFVGSLIILLNYLFIRKIFNKQIGLISSLLISVSPGFVDLARQSRFFSLVVPLFYPFVYFLLRIFEGKKKYLFWLGVTFGLMLNFHYTPLMFLPVIFVVLGRMRKLLSTTDYFRLIIGFIIPNLAFIIFNAKTSFEMLKQLFIWVPYRIAGFGGLIPKNNLTFSGVADNLVSLSLFISDQFLPLLNTGSLIICIVFLFSVIFLIKNYRKSRPLMILLSLLLTGYLALFIHGNPPAHYYLPLYPIPMILVAFVLDKIKFKRTIILFLVLLGAINSYFTVRSLFKETQSSEVSYNTQLAVSKRIVADANGKNFTLSRIGPNDDFERNYAQNYIYLMWREGNEPVIQSDLNYTLVEPNWPHKKEEVEIFEINGVKVFKDVNK